MQLLLHVGMGKTGTSTLQETLATNARALARAGVLYPPPPRGHRDHNALTLAVREAHRVPRIFRPGNLTPEAQRRRGLEAWDRITAAARASAGSTTVVSAELLFYLDDVEMDRLQALLSSAFDDVEVVAYVRAPASYYRSSVQQTVKASHRIRPPAHFRYPARPCLSRYRERFGDRMHVRPFERASLVDRCIVSDFLHHFVHDGDRLAAAVRVTDVNESMSGEAMCIMQDLRRVGWPLEVDRFVPGSDAVARRLRELAEATPQAPPRLQREVEAAITARFRADVEWLETEFGIELPSAAAEGSSELAAEPAAWRSQDLREILDVDSERIEETLYHLIAELGTEVSTRGPLARIARRGRGGLSSLGLARRR